MSNTATNVHGTSFNTGGNLNGRRSGGFSLRRALENQGVTTERAMQRHLKHVLGVLKVVPHADITRYRVNTNNPNKAPSKRIRIAR